MMLLGLMLHFVCVHSRISVAARLSVVRSLCFNTMSSSILKSSDQPKTQPLSVVGWNK